MSEFEKAIQLAYQKACNDLFFALRAEDQKSITLYTHAANGLQDAYPELIDAYLKEQGIV